jgi:hypothetical protein
VSIAIPEATYFRICAAAEWLAPPDRAPFYRAVATELAHCDVGEGSVSRAINLAFKAFYRAPLEVDQHAPQQLRKLGDTHQRVLSGCLARRYRRRQVA